MPYKTRIITNFKKRKFKDYRSNSRNKIFIKFLKVNWKDYFYIIKFGFL
jgi:hypothetical protein